MKILVMHVVNLSCNVVKSTQKIQRNKKGKEEDPVLARRKGPMTFYKEDASQD